MIALKAVKLQDAVKLAKLAGKHANVDSARRFTTHVVPEVTRPARVVWNQAIGLLVLVLALMPAQGAYKLFQKIHTDSNADWDLGTVAIITFFAIAFLGLVGFGISSFLKARRIASRVTRL